MERVQQIFMIQDQNDSANESSSNEDESSHTVKDLTPIIETPNIEEDPNSDEKSEEDEGVEDLQEAFGKLYLESLEISTAKTMLKKEINQLHEKSKFLEINLNEVNQCMSSELEM